MQGVYEFAEKALKDYDPSHDISHGIRVFSNVIENCYFVMNDVDYVLLWHICLLHDTIDHKYTDRGITREQLLEFLISRLGHRTAEHCLEIMENISWSKHVKGENKSLDGPWRKLQEMVQDADWLDALGENGLRRCIDYSLAKGLPVPENVCLHMEEKLFKIPSQLHSKKSRERAEILMKPLREYYDKHAANFQANNMFF